MEELPAESVQLTGVARRALNSAVSVDAAMELMRFELPGASDTLIALLYDAYDAVRVGDGQGTTSVPDSAPMRTQVERAMWEAATLAEAEQVARLALPDVDLRSIRREMFSLLGGDGVVFRPEPGSLHAKFDGEFWERIEPPDGAIL